MKTHNYKTQLKWAGNRGAGTKTYGSYERDHSIEIPGKPPMLCSSDHSFRGDKTRYNPEELLLSAISSCHMLWYLHLCSDNGIVVIAYEDEAKGIMVENSDGSGQFSEVVLAPKVTITVHEKAELAYALHKEANKKCFIARSVNFHVHHEPAISVSE